MDITDILKLYGPLSIGWIAAAYLAKFVLDRYDADIKSRTDLAVALQQLAEAVREARR
ncbi:hypothetical protein UFOVP1326_4 [uncultured Caudovirales phage]|uniref:Uncharacterized protein n=1 Tax=uncultured Caudovirales phage TaxID=2100421 RepID=A0A6J5SG79_9CAUD|nr:hypothetical protein UFOVP1326_4 [uncultured Caudovirales phage]CAB4212798.1 hypothetical protein UFOVP1436_35 [uncultured Caudovirales phage]